MPQSGNLSFCHIDMVKLLYVLFFFLGEAISTLRITNTLGHHGDIHCLISSPRIVSFP